VRTPTLLWGAALLLAVGALNAWLGYLIWHRRVYGLIAGYDARRPPRDPERLGRWVGVGSVVLGGACIVTALALAAFPAHAVSVMRAFGPTVVCVVTIMIAGAVRRSY
jgi:hypothetical protein